MTMNVAVIGAGAIGKHHARVFSAMAGARLVAVCDANEGTAADVAQKHGATPYADHTTMLEKERPRAVSIAVPTPLHRSIALDALARGCDILIEKPIAMTEAEAREILDASKAAGRRVMVGHVERFNPAVIALKERLRRNDVGKILHMEARRQGPFPERMQGDIGVVVDLAVHDIDIMRFVTGDEVERVYGETMSCIEGKGTDVLSGLVRMRSGIIGTLNINWVTPTKIREFSVIGEKGMIAVNYLTQELTFFENASANSGTWEPLDILRGVSEGHMVRDAIVRHEPLAAELEAFIAALRDGRDMPVSGEDGIIALRIALALEASGATHGMILP